MSHLQTLREEEEERIAEEGALDDVLFTYDRPELSNKVTLRRSSTGLWKVCSSGHNHSSINKHSNKGSPVNVIFTENESSEEEAVGTLVKSTPEESLQFSSSEHGVNCSPLSSLRNNDDHISKPSRRGERYTCTSSLRSRTAAENSVGERKFRTSSELSAELNVNHKYPTRQKGPLSA